MRILTTFLLTLILLTSCSETNTADPIDSFKYWARTNPPDDLKVIEGKYWQSGHWTREYILFLKINPTDKWWNEFINQNQLQADNTKWIRPSDSPDWFEITDDMEIFGHGDNFNDSRYFRNKRTGECYIYEIQL